MKFLGESPLKKLIALIKGDLANKADKNHTHNYAGSSSAGGAANSANKLNTNAGSATNPVYFKDGVPVKTTYTLEKSVPSDAKFTDTVTEVDATLTAGGTNPVQGGAIKSYIDEKTAGLTGAMHFQGKATVDITDGSTTDPVISGYDFANKKAKGDVILGKDDNKEYVWTGSVWEELGDEGSYALKTELNKKISKSGDTFSGTLTYNGGTTGSNPKNIAINIGQGNLCNIDKIYGVNAIQFGEYDSSGSLNDCAFLTTLTNSEGTQYLLAQSVINGNDTDISLRGIGLPTEYNDATNKYYVDNKVTALTAADVGAATLADIAIEIRALDVTEIGGTGKYIQSIQQTDGKISATAGTMPAALKNPNALTFTGAVTGTYDGSAAKTVNIPAAITVDDTLSDTSSNPIQNKVVKNAIDSKFNKTGGTLTGSINLDSNSIRNVASLYLGTNLRCIHIWNSNQGNVNDPLDLRLQGLSSKVSDDSVKVGGLATPVNDDDAANKAYVDAKVPNITTANNGQFLRVVNGTPTWVALTNVAEEGA